MWLRRRLFSELSLWRQAPAGSCGRFSNVEVTKLHAYADCQELRRCTITIVIGFRVRPWVTTQNSHTILANSHTCARDHGRELRLSSATAVVHNRCHRQTAAHAHARGKPCADFVSGLKGRNKTDPYHAIVQIDASLAGRKSIFSFSCVGDTLSMVVQPLGMR